MLNPELVIAYQQKMFNIINKSSHIVKRLDQTNTLSKIILLGNRNIRNLKNMTNVTELAVKITHWGNHVQLSGNAYDSKCKEYNIAHYERRMNNSVDEQREKRYPNFCIE